MTPPSLLIFPRISAWESALNSCYNYSYDNTTVTLSSGENIAVQVMKYCNKMHIYSQNSTVMGSCLCCICRVFLHYLNQHGLDLWDTSSGVKQKTLCSTEAVNLDRYVHRVRTNIFFSSVLSFLPFILVHFHKI